jgi:RHS repeat-associated protein
LGNRLAARTTGLEFPPLLAGGSSAEAYTYTARGLLGSIGGSYGLLIGDIDYLANGRIRRVRYTDAASTLADFSYDAREFLKEYHLYRGGAAVWSIPGPSYSPPGPSTTQTDLAHYQFKYDDVGNPVEIADLSASTWPGGAKPVTRQIEYDGLYRARRVHYLHGSDIDVPAFLPEAVAGNNRPVAELRGIHRVMEQGYAYDFLGNTVVAQDDEKLVFDRSLGTITHGHPAADGGVEGPNQLTSTDAGIAATYDRAGNLKELVVPRTSCWASMPQCSHRFLYDWDEIGQLVGARRWDYPAGAVPAASPAFAPAWELAYAYADGARVRVSARDSAGGEQHSLYVFDTLRADRVPYNPATGDYDVRAENEVGFLGGMSRVFLDASGKLPMPGPTRRHIYFHLSDHLGSTAFVLDKDSGEVVERTTYQAYGALETDYRPERWQANREEYKFTGKEEDIEVGLNYFGARYYSARLGRWISPDPLTVHAVSADLNPYAYVRGQVMASVDPRGLDTECDATGCYEVVYVRGTKPTRPMPDRGPSREGQLWTGPTKYLVQMNVFGLAAGMIADPERTVKTIAVTRLELVEGLLGESNTTSDLSYTPSRQRGSQG